MRFTCFTINPSLFIPYTSLPRLVTRSAMKRKKKVLLSCSHFFLFNFVSLPPHTFGTKNQDLSHYHSLIPDRGSRLNTKLPLVILLFLFPSFTVFLSTILVLDVDHDSTKTLSLEQEITVMMAHTYTLHSRVVNTEKSWNWLPVIVITGMKVKKRRKENVKACE